jgi:hypothetical protein
MASQIVSPEKCRVCGCTELQPCLVTYPGGVRAPEPCAWLDPGHTLCSNPRCVALVPLDELIDMAGLQW